MGKKFCFYASVPVFYLAISACAIRTPGSLSSSDVTVGSVSAIEFPAIDATDTLRARWAFALTSSFAKESVSRSPEAPFIADFALSIRPAVTGIAITGEETATIDWQSRPRKVNPFDKCKAQRARGTLAVFRRSDGIMIYRGEVEADSCDFDDSSLSNLADRLVADALK